MVEDHGTQLAATSTCWCGLRPRVGKVKMTASLPESPSNPGHSPHIGNLDITNGKPCGRRRQGQLLVNKSLKHLF